MPGTRTCENTLVELYHYQNGGHCLDASMLRATEHFDSAENWPLRITARHIHISDNNWDTPKFEARTLGASWKRWQRPVLALTADRLIVSRGQNFQVHDFRSNARGLDTIAEPRQISTLPLPDTPLLDITGIAVLESRTQAPGCSTVVVSRENGTLTRFVIPPAASEAPSKARMTATYALPRIARGSPVKCLASADSVVLALSSNGVASVFDAASPWTPPTSFSLPAGSIPWSGHLSLHSSTPFALIGATNPHPLSVYPFHDGTLSRAPIALLDDGTDTVRSPAVYAICRPDPDSMRKVSFAWGASDQIVISGWHDGEVRVHDLRSSTRRRGSVSAGSSTLAPLAPVLTLNDRTSDAGGIYCIAVGGGSGSHVVAGQAVHGCISIWDARSPGLRRGSKGNGWTVYPLDSTWSPTYDLALEGSRLWGVGQVGPFLFDFGPQNLLGTTSTSSTSGWPEGPGVTYGDLLNEGSRTPPRRPVTYEHNLTRGVVIS